METTSTVRRPRIMHRSAGAVVIEGGRCLVLRRGQDWVFPKGHLEQNEEPEATVRREILEETGLNVAVLDHLGATTFDFRSPGGTQNRKRVDWYLARPTGGTLKLEPIFRAAAYLTPAEAAERLTFQEDRGIAARAFELDLRRA